MICLFLLPNVKTGFTILTSIYTASTMYCFLFGPILFVHLRENKSLKPSWGRKSSGQTCLLRVECWSSHLWYKVCDMSLSWLSFSCPEMATRIAPTSGHKWVLRTVKGTQEGSRWWKSLLFLLVLMHIPLIVSSCVCLWNKKYYSNN